MTLFETVFFSDTCLFSEKIYLILDFRLSLKEEIGGQSYINQQSAKLISHRKKGKQKNNKSLRN